MTPTQLSPQKNLKIVHCLPIMKAENQCQATFRPSKVKLLSKKVLWSIKDHCPNQKLYIDLYHEVKS